MELHHSTLQQGIQHIRDSKGVNLSHGPTEPPHLLRVGNWLTLTLSEAEVIGSFSLAPMWGVTMDWCKIQRKSWRIGDFSQIINIQLSGLWKNSLKFRGSSFHSIDESIESKSCFKICPMKMTQRSDPFFECSWLEQFITSSDFCGQFLDAQFFVALLSLAAFTSEILERYFAGGWWWFCNKNCHKREWIPPEKKHLRRFHYFNPLPRRSSSFIEAKTSLPVAGWLLNR